MKTIFSKIAKDKLLHLYGGSLIYVLFSEFLVWWVALLIVATVGAGIELIYDKLMKKGTPEFLDFVYTVAGGMVVLLIKITVHLSTYLITI